VLHREHLSGQIENIGGRRVATILIDLMRRYDFTVRDSSAEVFFDRHAGDVFQTIRVLLRTSLRNYLLDAVLDEIGAVALQ
jgi:hypothetical protein